MKTIAEKQKTLANVPFLGSSSVWNIHISGITLNKRGNLCRDLLVLFQDQPDVETVCVNVGALGQTQHSETELLIFNVTGVESSEIADLSNLGVGLIVERTSILQD